MLAFFTRHCVTTAAVSIYFFCASFSLKQSKGSDISIWPSHSYNNMNETYTHTHYNQQYPKIHARKITGLLNCSRQLCFCRMCACVCVLTLSISYFLRNVHQNYSHSPILYSQQILSKTIYFYNNEKLEHVNQPKQEERNS